MGAIVDTKKAIERRLKQQFPTLQIAYEGVSFTPPNNAMYLVINFRVNKPTDPVLNKWYYRENITCNIFVCDLPNKGTGNAYSKAEEVRLAFDKGLTLIEGTTSIHILSTPQIAGSSIASDRVIVPVIISCTAEVSRT